MPSRYATLLLLTCLTCLTRAQDTPVTFNTNFESGSIGRIEVLAPDTFRLHVAGQSDQRGHNRQASWYHLRLDHVANRPLTLTLTDFVGEYNDKPGAVPMAPGITPVISQDDGRTWTHLPDADVNWNTDTRELTLHLKPTADSIHLAHVPPYTPTDLDRLLSDIDHSPHARIETIGQSCAGRDLKMVTVTDLATPDANKKVVWLQARQHAWESGTSFVIEGALRFITSDDPAAAELRRQVVFHFTPMVDPDGCAAGRVRFNANGYDVNRHWQEVDLRDKSFLKLMPEIWYHKKAITSAGRIDLMLNLHNTETNEYLDTRADDPATLATMRRFEDLLVQNTTYDPSRRLAPHPASTIDDTNSLWPTHHIPVMLMEQRISPGKKLGHAPTTQDRLTFGKTLLQSMSTAVLAH